MQSKGNKFFTRNKSKLLIISLLLFINGGLFAQSKSETKETLLLWKKDTTGCTYKNETYRDVVKFLEKRQPRKKKAIKLLGEPSKVINSYGESELVFELNSCFNDGTYRLDMLIVVRFIDSKYNESVVILVG